jgi:hypothetical protein
VTTPTKEVALMKNVNNPALSPSFGMPACGHVLVATPGASAWSTPATTGATTAVIDGAARTYALAQGVVAFANKRRTAKGSLSWRATDC